MIDIKVMDRGEGKTTKVIELMKKDQDLFCLIPINSGKRFYPRELQNRIKTADDFINGRLAGIKMTRVILDEGLLYNKSKLANLYYWLGFNHIDVISYGTE